MRQRQTHVPGEILPRLVITHERVKGSGDIFNVSNAAVDVVVSGRMAICPTTEFANKAMSREMAP